MQPLVIIADRIAQEGLDLLGEQCRVHGLTGGSLAEDPLLAEAEALIVRSETRVDADLIGRAPRLRVIGRAGAGVDTIDVPTATARGIVVVNAPGGNAIAAAEHALALMFSLARHIPLADRQMKQGQWKRSALVGSELTGKTLGLVGLGRVGTEVARRALGLEMDVLVYDPYVPDVHIRTLGCEPSPLDSLLQRANYVSLHVPLTDTTRSIIDAERLALMQPGTCLVNCARGELVDQTALLAALDAGTLAGAAIDVYPTEPVGPDDPLPHHPKVIATPHLGASTVEAQAGVAVQVVREVLAVLAEQPPQFAVNAPSIRPEEMGLLRPYMDLARQLGKLATQLVDGAIRSAEIEYRGAIAEESTSAVTATAIQGLLEPISDVPVNLVNARLLARQRGLEVEERRSATPEHYTSLVRVVVHASDGDVSVAGAVSDGRPAIVQIGDYSLHLPAVPGYLLLTSHHDRPGIIGTVGRLLGEADVNISSMQVGRSTARGRALMLLSVDDPIPPTVVSQLRGLDNFAAVKVLRL
ncbi:MAG: phosphoglycerate dehydrogenase [Chloroflexi bacterium]|nr:phosphoglycerate dehydrogenase [Chloroflexota bacterium]